MTDEIQTDSRSLPVRLRGALPSLHRAEARVARVFLEHAGKEKELTIAQAAEQAKTSTATVVRLYQRFGYPRYSGFWMDLNLAAARDAEVPPAPEGDVAGADSLGDVVSKIAHHESLSLTETAENLDLVALQQVVDLIVDAQRLDMFAAGASLPALQLFQLSLSRLGRTALVWADAHSAWTSVRAAPKGTLALAVSASGETAETIEFLELSREQGLTRVLITNTTPSEMSELADVVLATAAREAPFPGALGSRVAAELVLDCLFVAVAQRSYDVSVESLQEARRITRRS